MQRRALPRHLAHRGARPLAIDHSIPFLRRTRHRAQQARVGVAPIQSVAQQLPILDGVLDGAVIGGTLNEIGDRRAALAELARVTKPGAPVFVMSLGRATSRIGQILQRGLGLTGIEFPDAQRTAAEFSTAGFEVVGQRVDGLVIRTILRRLT
ncbi:MAG: class I SAM-dependent methyltransferase [Ilumatobacteraceae bacterium]